MDNRGKKDAMQIFSMWIKAGQEKVNQDFWETDQHIWLVRVLITGETELAKAAFLPAEFFHPKRAARASLWINTTLVPIGKERVRKG